MRFFGCFVLLSVRILCAADDYAQGVALFEKGDVSGAVPHLKAAVATDPDNPQKLKALGVAYAAQNQYALAAPILAKACTANVRLPDACYFAARAAYALDQHEQAIFLLRKIPGPHDARALQAEAQANEALGRADQAEPLYKQAVAASRNFEPAEAYGRFLLRRGRGTEAIPILQPFAADPHGAVLLGRIELERDHVDAAIPLLERAVAALPQDEQARVLLQKARARAPHDPRADHGRATAAPATTKSEALRGPLLLLRESKTAEARAELEKLHAASPNDAEIIYQIARSYLLDFYRLNDPERQRTSLALAMEQLNAALKRDPQHIPTLRAKAVIHARAELLYYDPNLSYELASRVAKLEPHANGFLLNLSEWMSGEVRFTNESGHRVPHDPLLGLDRAKEMLDSVVDSAMPYSNEESAALFLMGNTLARRGDFKDATLYYKQLLQRRISTDQKVSALRELGACWYRLGEYAEAARNFYEALQWRTSAVDQWLLSLAAAEMKGPKPRLPDNVVFPAASLRQPNNKSLLLEFEDMAKEVGITEKNGNGTVAFGDIDGDGAPDVLIAGSGVFLRAYRNDHGHFAEVTKDIGLEKVPSGYSLNLVDYDNDGWLDLYLSLNGWSGPMRNMLFHNEHGKFVNVSKQSGADDPGSGFVSVWGDLDNDGWPDIVIANGVLKEGSVPQIYRNNHDGTFTNMTKAAGINEPPSYGAIGVALGDYDKDGRLDILINGRDNAPNRLYHNDGNWKFTEVAAKAGVVQPPHNGFVCFFVDYNNDGWPDVLTTSLAPWEAVAEGLKEGYKPTGNSLHPDASRLFRNNKDGTFTDVTVQSGLFYPMGTMGAGVADVDNDGYVDFYFGTGDPQISRLEPNRFFHNNGNGTFSDLTNHVNFARPGNKGHGVAFIDIDNDGDLDIFAQLGGHYPGDHAYNAFYRNLKGNQNHWLEVDLEGTRSNRFGIGTKLTAQAGSLLVYREVKGSEGFGATSPYRQHMGFGNASKIDSLLIEWPSGIKQTLTDVPVNQVLKVKEQ